MQQTGKLPRRALLGLALIGTLAACGNVRGTYRTVAPNVRAGVDANGEIVSYQMFQLDIGRWYDARPTRDGGYALTERGRRRYQNDQWREAFPP